MFELGIAKALPSGIHGDSVVGVCMGHGGDFHGEISIGKRQFSRLAAYLLSHHELNLAVAKFIDSDLK